MWFGHFLAYFLGRFLTSLLTMRGPQARVIEMWGGADKIRQQAEKRSTEYLTSIESIWHMFEPIDGVKVLSPPLSPPQPTWYHSVSTKRRA